MKIFSFGNVLDLYPKSSDKIIMLNPDLHQDRFISASHETLKQVQGDIKGQVLAIINVFIAGFGYIF